MDQKVKKMGVKEFRELGYLQEVNRRFLHPLGLALEVVIDEDGEHICEVWDCRDDPEGIYFGEGVLDKDKGMRIYREGAEKGEHRLAKLGFVYQQLPEK